jgi:hypothetical protein
MIDPSFWDDHYIGTLSDPERLFVLGCIGNADDEGRLKGHPAYLKAAIFMYDTNKDETCVSSLKTTCLDKMASWPATHPYHLVPYQNSNEEYLFFPNWVATNRPSHPTKSQLPPPPPEALPIFSRVPPEKSETPPTQAQASLSRTSPEDLASPSAAGQVRSGQVRLGKGSIGDFTKITDETEMTDRLTDLLVSAAAGTGPRLREAAILRDFWQQVLGEPMNSTIDQFTFLATQDYPPAVLARAYAKAVKYKGGKTGSYKYIDVILKEEMAKNEKNRSP